MNNFSWQTLEYVHREKTSDWYWTVGIITSSLVVVSFIFGNFLFGIVLAIGAFMLTLLASRKPNIIKIEISEKGVKINKTLYPYITLDSFYIDEEHRDGINLFLKSKKVVMPLISIPVEHEDVDSLKTFLSTHLKEEMFNQGLLQIIFERLGF